MEDNQPVFLRRSLATALRKHLEKSNNAKFGTDNRRHLFGIVRSVVLTEDWESDTTYDYLLWKTKAKIFYNELSKFTPSHYYPSDDEIEIDVYAEKKIGSQNTRVFAAYCGVWIILSLAEFDVVKADYNSSGEIPDSVKIPLRDFEEDRRAYLDADFSREPGQWFVSDGATAAAPLPYVKRESESISFAVAKDTVWDWEKLRTIEVLKKPDGASHIVTGVSLSESGSGGISVVTDVQFLGSNIASATPTTETIAFPYSNGPISVVTDIYQWIGTVLTGLSIDGSSGSGANEIDIITDAILTQQTGSGSSGDDGQAVVLTPTNGSLLITESAEVMETPESLGYLAANNSSGGEPAPVDTITFIEGMEVSNTAGTTFTNASQFEFVSNVYCDGGEIVVETKIARLKSGRLTIIPGSKTNVIKSVEPGFEVSTISVETDRKNVVATTGLAVNNITFNTQNVEQYTSGSAKTVVTGLNPLSASDMSLNLTKKDISVNTTESIIESKRVYFHDNINGGEDVTGIIDPDESE